MKPPVMEKLVDAELDTPHGRLYRPSGNLAQIACLIAVFFGGPLLGEGIGRYLGDLSEAAQIVLYLPFVAIFFLGYAFWMARLSAIAFDGIGRSVLKALFMLIVRRKKPENLQDLFPTREKLLEMAVRAQKAAWSFLLVGIPVSFLAALAALLFDTATPTAERVLLVGGASLFWGWLLATLGRRGILPIAEDE